MRTDRFGAFMPERPLLIYDGDCRFCNYSVDYARAATGSSIDFRPYQEVASATNDGVAIDGDVAVVASGAGELGAMQVFMTGAAGLDVDLLVVTALALRLAKEKRRHALVAALLVAGMAALAVELALCGMRGVGEVAAKALDRSRLGAAMTTQTLGGGHSPGPGRPPRP